MNPTESLCPFLECAFELEKQADLLLKKAKSLRERSAYLPGTLVPVKEPKQRFDPEDLTGHKYGDDKTFCDVWKQWIKYRRSRGSSVKEIVICKQLKMLASMDRLDAVASMEQSMCNGWIGLFEVKQSASKNGSAGHNKHDGYVVSQIPTLTR